MTPPPRCILLAALAALLAACSAGGPDKPPPAGPLPAPTIQVMPTSYDFGKVTSGNAPAPLEVSIANGGNASLNVSAIAFAAANPNFELRLSGGAEPCGTATPTIAPGRRCTVAVAFAPSAAGAHAASLEIRSNAAGSPAALSIAGTSEAVSALVVRINQIAPSCPTAEVTAYVSVTDQGGYPVRGLDAGAFQVSQGTTTPPVLSATWVDLAYQPVAVAAALDFSSSLTSQPVAFADMKNGFADFFGGLRSGDTGEVIKFGSEIEVTQAFTADRSALLAAIAAPFDKGGGTKLHDAIVLATQDAAAQVDPPGRRRAVVLATDGSDVGSVTTRAGAVQQAVATGVPVFAIGLGGSIARDLLQEVAAATGGLYYEAGTSQNLATIYEQLSSILYRDQYVLRFDAEPGPVSIGASSSGVGGSGASTVPACGG